MCFAITFVQLDGFWTNLADCFLNMFCIKQCKQISPEPSTSFVLCAETWKSLIQQRRLYSFLQAFQMKVLVDYSTHCSTTRSSFSFDLTSCSVSLRGILLAEYKILYGINVASQAADVQCVLQRILIPYKILYSARRMPPNSPNNSSDWKKQQMLPDTRRMSGDVCIFQQDSAPAHRARDTIELLRRETPDFIGPDVWPANLPDLNPVDYRIWWLIQERVYQTAIRDIDDLKQCLTCVWAELKQSVVDKAIEQWRPRLRACIRAKGQHFEQLLNWTLHFLV